MNQLKRRLPVAYCLSYPNGYNEAETEGKPLCWEGSSTKDFREFPIDVQRDMGALFIVQLSCTPDSANLWKGLGSGVYKLVEDLYREGGRYMCYMRSRRRPSLASPRCSLT